MDDMWILAAVIAWFGASILNLWVLQWGKRRLAKAFHGGPPAPMDAFDLVGLLLLSPFGPVGVLIVVAFTDWWCRGFEPPDDDARQEYEPPKEPQSRAKVQALRRAGWSEQEITAALSREGK